MSAEMANFANTHAYYALANPALVDRVRQEARRRMTADRWGLALRGDGLLGWQRDYILARCRPEGAVMGPSVIVSSALFVLRDRLRRLVHLFCR